MPRRYVQIPDPPRKRITPSRTRPPSRADSLFNLPRQTGDERTWTTRPEEQQPGEPQREVLEHVRPSPPPRRHEPRPQPPDWIVRAREIDLLTVAELVGVEIGVDDMGSKVLRPCPRCGDADGAQVIWNRGYGVSMWRCPACGTMSGVLDLAALTLMGAPLGELDDEGHELVSGFFEGLDAGG